jgi:hypothetical protein
MVLLWSSTKSSRSMPTSIRWVRWDSRRRISRRVAFCCLVRGLGVGEGGSAVVGGQGLAEGAHDVGEGFGSLGG